MPEEIKALSRRWLEAGYGRGDTAAMTALMPLQMLEEGSLREQIVAYRAAFPDLTVSIDEQIAEGERVVNRITFRGTHTGDLLGLAPTGKPMEIQMAEVHTVRGGQIVDLWNTFHPVLVLAQLGLLVGKDDERSGP